MITGMIRKFGRAVFMRTPVIRRLIDSLESIRCVANQLEEQVEMLQGRLLESEIRNAQIPLLEKQAEVLQGRLLESEIRNAQIPLLEKQAEVLQGRLLESEIRNAQIPVLERTVTDARAELRFLKKTLIELELAQIEIKEQLGEIAFAEERLGLLKRNTESNSQTATSTITGGNRRLMIGILGNVNNYPLMLAEGFRRLGHEVRLVINHKNPLHRPESKYPEWQNNYPEWVLDCSALSEEALMSNSAPLFSKVINYFLDQADLVILNDFFPSVAKLLPKPQMVLLTGSDLTYYANYHSLDIRTAIWDLEYKKSLQGRRLINQYADFVTQQRDGILSADVVSFGMRGLIPEADELLDSIGVSDSRRMMLLLSDIYNLNFSPPCENKHLRIFNGARVAWQQSKDKQFSRQDLKGTDVLLRGFAMYCQSGGQGELRMVQKGHDVAAAFDLCSELGIDSRVVWLDEMTLHQYAEEVRLSDLVCDQFGQSFPGMVTSHAYALGRPVLANFRNEIFAVNLSNPLPGFQAASASEVAERLLALDADRKAIQAMGKKSRQYAEKYMSPDSMAKQVLIRTGLNKQG